MVAVEKIIQKWEYDAATWNILEMGALNRHTKQGNPQHQLVSMKIDYRKNKLTNKIIIYISLYTK